MERLRIKESWDCRESARMEVTCPYHWKLIKIIYRIRWGAQEKDIQINVFRKKQRKKEVFTEIKDKKEE
jgi:hypothetical protein